MRSIPVRFELSRYMREEAQAFVLFAAVAALMFAAVGLAVDIGQVVGSRTEMQKAADAAALAGAQGLPDPATAVAIAEQYALENAPTGAGHEFLLGSIRYPNDSITVIAKKRVNYTFLRIFGLPGTTVTAKATTRRSVFAGGFQKNLLPWGFIAGNDPTSALLQNSCYLGSDSAGVPIFKTRVSCIIKYGSGYHDGGDFGAVKLDPNKGGGGEYQRQIEHGSDIPHYVGDRLESETGNMHGPTRDGVFYRLEQPPPPGCPGVRRQDVLIDHADGTVSIRKGCEDSARLIVIPVVDKINRDTYSTVVGFALMWLEGMVGPAGNVKSPGGSGGSGEDRVKGEFLRLVSPLPGGRYGSASSSGPSIIEFVE